MSASSLTLQLAACLARYLQPGCRLCVGYSGGLDSSVLLHQLANLRQQFDFQLSAVHVHHGLSPDADAWAQHCTQVCCELAIPLTLHRVEVRRAGEGLEAAARDARYRVFAQLDIDVLLLAQHQDDQAETVLLQLLRGAGMKGLAAMPEARGFSGRMILLRPWLAASRAEIAACAHELGLSWIEDASNVDQGLARNALRHGVLPALIERFPGASKALAQAAVQFAEAAVLLDELADQDGRAAIAGSELNIPALRALPEPRARNVLRRFLELSGAPVQHDGLLEALRQLCTARQDAQVRLLFGRHLLRRYRDRALIEARPDGASAAPGDRLWRGESCIDLGASGSLSFQSAVGAGVNLSCDTVSIRLRQGGERMRCGAGRPRRTLKNLLREAGIPAWQRSTLPLIYCTENLVWAAGVGADSDHLASPGQPGWLISWQPPNRAG
jgi:tRNA(Ile)-lysidine synthase